MKYKSI